MTTAAVVLSLDKAWILPLLEVIEYSEGNAWVYVRTPRGRYYAHRDEITIYPEGKTWRRTPTRAPKSGNPDAKEAQRSSPTTRPLGSP